MSYDKNAKKPEFDLADTAIMATVPYNAFQTS